MKDKLERDFKRDRSGKHAKTLDKRMDMMEKVDRPPEIRTFTIPLDAKIGSGNFKDHDIVLEHGVCGYMQPVGTDSPADANSGGNVLVRELDLGISFGERIVLLGGNGMGKSTSFKTITVVVGNLMQEHERYVRCGLLV
ncbi:hypothetical protein, variant [Sphaeroforma arctica JP610]|uniref:ABC transporter domain-containing protein n=1 Tax=Sphaeroforma arctica JP610 TaxID=667725 RepID=A0A0L0FEH3_9EUKA|nr:hypothetical protein, variant [Sphaeroforma arctica JP610]KNC75162.1 hypothetical protein, variant [Sphaeroforma arctica JP610]|eukprot:XP_014149064.1 hypothetical protein, variant [Sphaeroforma arctica JP610]